MVASTGKRIRQRLGRDQKETARKKGQTAPHRGTQLDLLGMSCVVCKGRGEVFFAINMPRGRRPGTIEHQTCPLCRGTGVDRNRPRR